MGVGWVSGGSGVLPQLLPQLVHLCELISPVLALASHRLPLLDLIMSVLHPAEGGGSRRARGLGMGPGGRDGAQFRLQVGYSQVGYSPQVGYIR